MDIGLHVNLNLAIKSLHFSNPVSRANFWLRIYHTILSEVLRVETQPFSPQIA